VGVEDVFRTTGKREAVMGERMARWPDWKKQPLYGTHGGPGFPPPWLWLALSALTSSTLAWVGWRLWRLP
jgi:hypothetical protein